MAISFNFPSISPSLVLDFVNSTNLDPRITFSRNDATPCATYFDASGTLRVASANIPRFDYNPITLAARGLLIEEQRANSLTYSEDLTDASWVKNAVTISSNTIVAPDGLTTADKMDETAVTTGHGLDKSFSYVSGTTYTISYFVKAAERSAINHLFPSAAFGSNLNARFDLTTGAFSSVSAGVTTFSQNVGNGWWRIAFTATATTSVTTVIRINLLDTIGGSTSYLGVLGSGLYFWGAQLEVGAFPTSYIPTTTTALTRSADVASVNTLTPWFNATEGTLFAQAEVPVITQTGRTMVSIGRAVASAYEIYVNITSTGAPGLPVATILASTTQFQYQPTPERTSTKGALAYKTNDSQAAFDGTSSATDTSVTLPDLLATLYIGKRDDITPLNGWLKRIVYYPIRLIGTQLQSLTNP